MAVDFQDELTVTLRFFKRFVRSLDLMRKEHSVEHAPNLLILVSRAGLEPATLCLKGICSTD